MVNIDKKGHCIIKRGTIKVQIGYMLYKFLKLARDDASFPSAERSFQALAPLKEKHFRPVFELFLGSLKSASVFLKHKQC